MPYIRKHIFLLVLFFGLYGSSQNFSTVGETAIALNHNVSKNYSINFSLEPRYSLYQNRSFLYENIQMDFSHFSTFRLNINHALSLGFVYRNREWFDMGSGEIRLTEQYNYKKQKLGVRYGHRIRLEQRFIDDFSVFRQRYRFAVDFPLNGEKLDINEAYFISSVEGLLSLAEKLKPETDLRLAAQIGWQISKIMKLQTGLEHRFEALNIKVQNNLFVLTSAILKI